MKAGFNIEGLEHIGSFRIYLLYFLTPMTYINYPKLHEFIIFILTILITGSFCLMKNVYILFVQETWPHH